MCNQPDYQLPEHFITAAQQFEAAGAAPDTAALIQKIAEQTGLSPESITNALALAGMAAFRAKGILF